MNNYDIIRLVINKRKREFVNNQMKKTYKNTYLTLLNEEIEYVKESILGHVSWVEKTSDEIKRKLEREDYSITFPLNSLGEYQREPVLAEQEIVRLSTLVKAKRDYLNVLRWKREKKDENLSVVNE